MNNKDPLNSTNAELSKTKLKKHSEELQNLGVSLIKLSNKQLDQFELDDALKDAIKFAKTIKSNSALKRQYQYIGKLMKEGNNEECTKNALSTLINRSNNIVRIQNECEKWKNNLLKSDSNLNLFIAKYPNTNITELRNLIRATRKELKNNQNKHYQRLFQLIYEQIQSYKKE